MDAAAWTPHGRALWDYFQGDTKAALRCFSSLGEDDLIPSAVWFRPPESFFPFDHAALERCRGRVLDVGAGAGAHCLVLQQRGFEVVAIDAVPEAVEILRGRGVRDARLLDVFALEHAPDRFDTTRFDTVLMLANGAGIAETLEGLDRLLVVLDRILAPGGQVLIDSTDVRSRARPRADGRYIGEIDFSLEYRGLRGATFRQLYVDPATFRAHAARAGFDFEPLGRFEGESYLARLTRAEAAGGVRLPRSEA